jgi:hypothetical protein
MGGWLLGSMVLILFLAHIGMEGLAVVFFLCSFICSTVNCTSNPRAFALRYVRLDTVLDLFSCIVCVEFDASCAVLRGQWVDECKKRPKCS